MPHEVASTELVRQKEEVDSYVVDGPFIEAKEHIGGFAVIEVGTMDEALELARTWPAGGSVEVRRVVERG